MKKVIVIPARLESSRLPNKLLLNLGNKRHKKFKKDE